MAKRERLGLVGIRTEGAILPPSLLQRIHAVDEKLGGLKPEDFGLSGTRVREAASQAWNALQGPWLALKAKREDGSPDLGPTRAWIRQILRALHYGDLELRDRDMEAEDRSLKVSALYSDHLPIYVVGHRQELDKKPSDTRITPHGNLQLLLNARDENLWGFVTNGRQWRILRDSVSLSRQAMVEVDLETIFEGGLYDEFLLFFLLCHQSRVRAERPTDCWLEKWSQAAGEEGKRALDTLRDGVQKAIETVGQGFLRHPANANLRERLRSGELDKQDYYRQLLRFVYRLLFLFVAEDRDLLASPSSNEDQRRLYIEAYSTQRLRLLAEKLRGAHRHHDLYVGLKLVLTSLGDPKGCTELGLAPLGGIFSTVQTQDLDGADLSNADLLEAIRCLAVTREGGRSARVDYKNLGSEELGSVYESLLELHPDLSTDGTKFELRSASGNERKTSGSYYTPDSLIQCLLDTALDPVVAESVRTAKTKYQPKDGEPPEAQAILEVKVVDPAVGSGHFLIAAAHRLAKRLAQSRTGDEEPSPAAVRRALRDVIGRCLYGVDLNPMAAELCKVALWMEAMEPGKPLTFLDHHIQVGNSLLGATPELIAKGIPDGAYHAIEDDDKALCALLKKQNKAERGAQGDLFNAEAFASKDMLKAFHELELLPDETIEQVRKKEKTFREAEAALQMRRLMADAWCAAFVLPKTSPKPHNPASGAAVTTATLRRIANGAPVDQRTIAAIHLVRDRLLFLHPHLAFPEVFASGGFDVVLGNPPWDIAEVDEVEFFAGRDPGIADASNPRERNALINQLADTNPVLYTAFQHARRDLRVFRLFAQESGRFPKASAGRINLYPLFVELAASLLRPKRTAALVVPTDIAFGAYNSALFETMLLRWGLLCLLDFENRGLLFPDVDSRYRISIIAFTKDGPKDRPFKAAFRCLAASDLSDPSRVVMLSVTDLRIFSPTTLMPPIVRGEKELELLRSVYSRCRTLATSAASGGWGCAIQRMVSLSDPGDIFRTQSELDREPPSLCEQFVRIYSGKTIHIYNHRFATFANGKWRDSSVDELSNSNYEVATENFVRREVVEAKTKDKQPTGFLIGFRDIARNSDERTAILAVVPKGGCDSHCRNIYFESVNACLVACFVAAFNSFAFDFIARSKVVSTTFGATVVEQLAMPLPSAYTKTCPWDASVYLWQWVVPRVLELTHTSHSTKGFAEALGYVGAPFGWSNERRSLLRDELDAAMFHCFGFSRDEAEYILETFPIVKRKDLAAHGRYRTKENILEIYDEMAAATQTDEAKEVVTTPQVVVPAMFPSTQAEVALCALLYDIVEQRQHITDEDALLALVLAVRPEFCRHLLSADDLRDMEIYHASGLRPRAITSKTNLQWKACRDYLETAHMITVDRSGIIPRLSPSAAPSGDVAKHVLSYSSDAAFALKALDRCRAPLPADSATVQTARRSALDMLAAHVSGGT